MIWIKAIPRKSGQEQSKWSETLNEAFSVTGGNQFFPASNQFFMEKAMGTGSKKVHPKQPGDLTRHSIVADSSTWLAWNW